MDKLYLSATILINTAILWQMKSNEFIPDPINVMNSDNIKCTLLNKDDLVWNNFIDLYPIDCQNFIFNESNITYYQNFYLVILSSLFIYKLTIDYKENYEKNTLIKIMFLIFYQITIPLFFSSIYQKIEESIFEVHKIKNNYYYGNISEMQIQENPIRIIYNKEIGRLKITDWIGLKNLISSFYVFLSLICNYSAAIYFLSITFAIFENFIHIPQNILFPVLINIGINLIYFFYLFKLNEKIQKFGYKCIYFGYFLVSFYVSFQHNNLGIFSELSKVSSYHKTEIIRFLYFSFFMGHTMQIFFTISIHRRIVKNKKSNIFLFLSLTIEWIYLLFFYWVDKFVMDNIIDLKFQNMVSKFLFIREGDLQNNLIIYSLVLSAGFSGFGLAFFGIQYIEIIARNKNSIKYFLLQYSFSFLGIGIIIYSNQIFELINKKELILLSCYQMILILSSIQNITNKIVYGEKEFECFICTDKTKCIKIFIPCGHYVCSCCYKDKIWNNCPMCRNYVKKVFSYYGKSCKLHKYSYMEYLKSNRNETIQCSRCRVSPGKYYPIYGLNE